MSPDSRAPVLDQLEGQWQKIAAVLVWKLAKDRRVVIGVEDFRELERANAAGQMFMSWGHYDSFEFLWLDEAAAEKLAAHVESIGGVAERKS